MEGTSRRTTSSGCVSGSTHYKDVVNDKEWFHTISCLPVGTVLENSSIAVSDLGMSTKTFRRSRRYMKPSSSVFRGGWRCWHQPYQRLTTVYVDGQTYMFGNYLSTSTCVDGWSASSFNDISHRCRSTCATGRRSS